MVLESAEVSEQQALVEFILTWMIKLGVKSIKTVKVYGRLVKTFDIAWHQGFELEKQVKTPTPLSAQPTSANTQASSQVKFSRKKVSEAEFRSAVRELLSG